MPRVFLSYRRDDTAGFAGRLSDALESELGADSVFRDVDDLKPGADFVEAIEQQLREVDVLLVMIGPRWLTTGDDGGRRLDRPDDFVRLEIESALASGKPVIPLLVAGASMPAAADLPASLEGLARRHAFAITDGAWADDVSRLVAVLRPLVAASRSPRRRAGLRIAVATAAALALAVVAGVLWPWRSADAPIAGEWTASVRYDWGATHEERFEFEEVRGAVRGTASWLRVPRIIEDGRIDGDALEFRTRSTEVLGDAPPREVVHRYFGTLADGRIRFRLETIGGFDTRQPVEFEAVPAPMRK